MTDTRSFSIYHTGEGVSITEYDYSSGEPVGVNEWWYTFGTELFVKLTDCYFDDTVDVHISDNHSPQPNE